jgi:uncharacterized membrane protein YkoI
MPDLIEIGNRIVKRRRGPPQVVFSPDTRKVLIPDWKAAPGGFIFWATKGDRKSMRKTFIAAIAVIALLAGNPVLGAEKVKLTDTPEAVQKTIIAERGTSAEVKGITIDRKSKDGQIVYDVEFKEPGKNPKLRLSADGTVIKANRPGTETTSSSSSDKGTFLGLGAKKLELTELPLAAQTTIREQSHGAEIDKIRQETKDGKTVYMVEFKEPGKNPKIWVNADGTIMKTNDKRVEGEAVTESAGAEKKTFTFNDLPAAVQTTLQKEKGDASIEGLKIKKDMKEGKALYKVEFEEKGKNTKLEIDESGAILKDNRK